jgi:2-phospho-L-lactate guanylyltransferase (CobY/MobA/RfbA family)
VAHLAAVIFEGGHPLSLVQRQMTAVRRGVTLDNLGKLLATPEIDQVILCTNYPELAEAAEALGAVVDLEDDTTRFHYGLRLRHVIYKYQPDKLLYMGGAAAPLIRPEELAEVARMTKAADQVVMVNNPQSPDLISFSPATAIDRIQLPDSDNVLGHLLREAGLPRVLMRNTAWINFDIDTPGDLLVLAVLSGAGPRTKEALEALRLDVSRVIHAKRLFSKVGTEVALIGRVSPSVALFINANFALRLRIYSEERGMRALGRVERGEVRSLVAQALESWGPAGFFEHLASVAEVAFFDTRVWMAHAKLELSEADRFHSDLGQVDMIENPRLREFTAAAFKSPIPVILGGHSLVAGGLWALAEHVIVEDGRQPIHPF